MIAGYDISSGFDLIFVMVMVESQIVTDAGMALKIFLPGISNDSG
ncbi:hypothetical protein [Methanosarcina acetivorans]|nr:hypothetical protein [Methanosarcina acetivorans]